MTEETTQAALRSNVGLDTECRVCDFENAKHVSRAKWCCPNCDRDFSIEYFFWAKAAHPEWFGDVPNAKLNGPQGPAQKDEK